MRYLVSIAIELVTAICISVFTFTSFVPNVLEVELTPDLCNIVYTTALVVLIIGAAIGLASTSALDPSKHKSRKEA